MLRALPALAVSCLFAGCASGHAPADVAGRFLDKYYVETDQHAALPLCAGPAARRIAAEIADLDRARRQGLEAPAFRPRMSYRRLGDRPAPSGGDREIDYELSIDSSGVRLEKRVDVLLRRSSAGWRVWQFGDADVTRLR